MLNHDFHFEHLIEFKIKEDSFQHLDLNSTRRSSNMHELNRLGFGGASRLEEEPGGLKVRPELVRFGGQMRMQHQVDGCMGLLGWSGQGWCNFGEEVEQWKFGLRVYAVWVIAVLCETRMMAVVYLVMGYGRIGSEVVVHVGDMLRGSGSLVSFRIKRRRERINERLRILQNLVPNGKKVDISTMLEEAVQHVKFLQLQIKAQNDEFAVVFYLEDYKGIT